MDKQAPHCELTGQVGLAGTPPGGQRNLRAIIAVFLILAWRNADSLGLDRFAFPMVRNRFAHGHGTGTGD